MYNRQALSESEEEGDYVTRYDRITGAQQDFSVFSSNLPGTNLHLDVIINTQKGFIGSFSLVFKSYKISFIPKAKSKLIKLSN